MKKAHETYSLLRSSRLIETTRNPHSDREQERWSTTLDAVGWERAHPPLQTLLRDHAFFGRTEIEHTDDGQKGKRPRLSTFPLATDRLRGARWYFPRQLTRSSLGARCVPGATLRVVAGAPRRQPPSCSDTHNPTPLCRVFLERVALKNEPKIVRFVCYAT